MKKLVTLTFLILLLTGCQTRTVLARKIISINNQKILVQVADTEAERVQGLSGRRGICDSCGMLFVFDQADRYAFWMKDMRFNLDLIWLKDGQIQEITPNVPKPVKGLDLPKFQPQNPVNQVLEVKAGQAAIWGLKPGQNMVEIKP